MRTLVSIGAILALAGCAQPSVELHPPQSQYKIDYAQHWQSLAERMADKLVTRLSEVPDFDPGGHMLGGARTVKSIGARPFYIHSMEADAAFGKVFVPMLQQEIRSRGRTVARSPRNSVVVNYSTQTFYHGPDGNRHPMNYASMGTTAAALGIAATNWSLSAGHYAVALLAIGPLLDYLFEKGNFTRAEVILTTSVVSANEIIHQDSEVFYVSPSNLPIYWSINPTGVPMDTENFGPVVQPVRTYRVEPK